MQRLVPARILAALRADATAPIEIAGDILLESRRRIRVAAGLGVATYAAFLLLELSRLLASTKTERTLDLAHDALGVTLCLSLLVVTGVRGIRDRQVLTFALVTQVLLAALISVAVPWAGFIRTAHVSSLTWTVPIIILFPLLVPTPPAIAFRVSALCALTMPLGLWLLAARGAIVAHAPDLWASSVTAAAAVGIATVAARTVYGARQQVAAATTLGSYELLERVGHGGMGEVWKARHLLLARPAAVKRILPEMLRGPTEEREALVKRFTREAQVTASLRSPHTVELYDFGTTPDGAFYYSMELLEGMNLEHFVYRFGPIAPRRAAHWLVQVCHSLGEAHSRGLVHRDIKPSNLYVCRFGREEDFIKVLDFGLTKPTQAAEADGLTGPGARLGTPGYMAPEQVFGLAADARTDLYALGCVGYWLIAGAKPFEARSAGELLRQHAQAAAPPLRDRAREPVPERLEALIHACLAKDPSERPADADALSEALSRAVDGAPWTETDAREWWQRQSGD